MKLKDRVAIITGGAAGIGLCSVRRFLGEGARVALVDIGRERVDAACAQLKDAGGEVLGFVVDVTQRAQVDAMVEAVKARWGRIDVLLNNAGITKDARL